MRYITFKGTRTIKKPNINNWQSAFWVSLSVSILTGIFVIERYELLLGPDDVGMRNILSGIYTGNPEPHVYFMYILLAKVLTALYTWFPNVYWYAWFLVLSNYGCLALVLYRFTSNARKHKIEIAVCISSAFSLLWLTFLITLEWTATAGILSATAIFLYATIPQDDEKKLKAREVLLPVFLLLISYNLRHNVAEMSIPFGGCVFLIKVIRNRNRLTKQFLRMHITFLSLCTLVFVGSFTLNRIAYSSEEWQEADAFSGYRSTMFDRYGWPDYDTYHRIYDENNITYEMYQCIKKDYNLMLTYKGVLSPENFKELSEIAKRDFEGQAITIKQRIKECAKKRLFAAVSWEYRLYTVFIYLGIFLAICCCAFRKDILQLFLCIIGIFGFECVWIWLYLLNRLPIHVGYSLNMLAVAMVVSFLWQEPLMKRLLKKKFIWVLIVLLLVCGVLDRLPVIRQRNEEEAQNGLLLSTVKQYCEEHNKNIYFRDFYSFNNSILYKERIEDRDEKIAANFIPPNGWTVILPFDNLNMPSNGQEELCTWIGSKDNIYLILEHSRATEACQRIVALFASRGINCQMVLEDSINIPNGKVFEVYHYQ